ncbi:hypothetical protein PAHAL_9G194700 [Panicum hallii]|uniref:rRNA N-glycosylase n=1 Tax=Panicum hallii TaxID=206008 RepID=A0A2S3IKX8_9POAL|nr:uncharacterized protein LOC112872791 [Panicum hallii]PAN46574.1 hypothetical protein PAHAL_9G194700 [Panicum hallii]
MAYLEMTLVLLLLWAQAPSQLYGIEVTEEMIYGVEARPIRYRASFEPFGELLDEYIQVSGTGEPISGLPAHPVQNDVGTAPPRWTPFDLVGRDEDNDRTRLMVRGDTGYLIGFANMTGHYHILNGMDPEGNLFPGATVLNTGVSYRDFVGPGGKGNLPGLPLSKDLFLDGIGTLGTYPAVSSDDERDEAMARFVVMILEAARIKPIRQRILRNWDVGETYIDPIHAKYIVTWGKMSLLLMCAERGIPLRGRDARELRSIHVETPADVKNILGIVVRPARFNPDNPEQSCAPMTT